MSLKIFAAGCVYIFLDLLGMFVCDFIKYMFNNLYNTIHIIYTYVTSNFFILSPSGVKTSQKVLVSL